MAGKSWQPSHEPLHAARETGTRRTVETVERWSERGWEENCLGDNLPHYEMQGECFLYVRHVTLCYNPLARGIPTCAYVSTLLTLRGTQVLFVVNCVKLHWTAFNNCIAKMKVGWPKHPGASTIGMPKDLRARQRPARREWGSWLKQSQSPTKQRPSLEASGYYMQLGNVRIIPVRRFYQLREGWFPPVYLHTKDKHHSTSHPWS